MPKEGDWIKEALPNGGIVEHEHHAPPPAPPLADIKTQAKTQVAHTTVAQQSQLIAEGVYLLLKDRTDKASTEWVAKYDGYESAKTTKEAAIDDAADETEVRATEAD